MDPPWQLASAQPSRGVALQYATLPVAAIAALGGPVARLQAEGGYLAMWVINAHYVAAQEMLSHWGYRVVDEVAWLKVTRHGRLAKGHGYYLQHAKETCLIAHRPSASPPAPPHLTSPDVLYAQRRAQSQKPDSLYALLEALGGKGGKYLEIFARPNNLRDGWISIGLEL